MSKRNGNNYNIHSNTKKTKLVFLFVVAVKVADDKQTKPFKENHKYMTRKRTKNIKSFDVMIGKKVASGCGY